MMKHAYFSVFVLISYPACSLQQASSSRQKTRVEGIFPLNGIQDGSPHMPTITNLLLTTLDQAVICYIVMHYSFIESSQHVRLYLHKVKLKFDVFRNDRAFSTSAGIPKIAKKITETKSSTATGNGKLILISQIFRS